MNPVPKNILIVEDDELVGKAIGSICGKLGYHVTVKASLTEARSALAQGRWDGYILDYSLPDGDGIELSHEIRARGDSAPIIFITGYATPEMVLESQDLGVVEVLAKPFKSADLHRVLNQYVPLTPTQPLPTDPVKKAPLVEGNLWFRRAMIAALILLGLAFSIAILSWS